MNLKYLVAWLTVPLLFSGLTACQPAEPVAREQNALTPRAKAEAAPTALMEPAPTTQEPKAPVPDTAPVATRTAPAAKKISAAAPTKPLPPVGKKLVLYFPFDSSHVEQQLMAHVRHLLAHLKSNPATTLVINGHADRAGPEEYNLRLSARRSDFMRNVLIKNGIHAKRVEFYAFGETDPAVPTQDGVALRANRRVEIFLE